MSTQRSVVLRVIGRELELRNDVPASRDECRDGPRPCGRVHCRYNLIHTLSLDRAGRPHYGRRAPTTLRLVWFDYAFWFDHVPTCALDVRDANPLGLDRAVVGRHLGVTAERIRQIEADALEKLAASHGELLSGEDWKTTLTAMSSQGSTAVRRNGNAQAGPTASKSDAAEKSTTRIPAKKSGDSKKVGRLAARQHDHRTPETASNLHDNGRKKIDR